MKQASGRARGQFNLQGSQSEPSATAAAVCVAGDDYQLPRNHLRRAACPAAAVFGAKVAPRCWRARRRRFFVAQSAILARLREQAMDAPLWLSEAGVWQRARGRFSLQGSRSKASATVAAVCVAPRTICCVLPAQRLSYLAPGAIRWLGVRGACAFAEQDARLASERGRGGRWMRHFG